MDQIGRPEFVYAPTGDLRRSVGEGRESNVVVAPVDASLVAIGGSDPLKETGADHDVIRQPVSGPTESNLKGR